MQAYQRAPSRGAQWLLDGFYLWKRSPAFLTFLCFGYFLVPLVLVTIPFIGQLAAALVVPALSLGVLNGCAAIDKRQPPAPDLLFSGFRQNLPALCTIGVFNFVATLLVLSLSTLLDGGVLLQRMAGTAAGEPGPADLGVLLLAITLYTPVSMAYWFAPVLAGWGGLGVGRALFFSLIACQRNWRPLLVFALCIMLVGGLIPGILVGLLGLISPTLAALFSILPPLLLIPIVFASFYVNARDVFADLEPGARR